MKTEHTNLASGYRYHGGNALILEQACQANAWTSRTWATKAQAVKLERPIITDAAGVVVVLNDRQFTIYNAAQMAAAHEGEATTAPVAAPSSRESAKVVTLRPTGKKALMSFNQFRDELPNRAAGWPREARAFYDGLPGGGTYQAHMGTERGEFLHAAMRALAEHGDSQGNRYTLELEQVGWAYFTEADKKGRPLKRVELAGLTGMNPDVEGERWEVLKEKGLVQPTYRMKLQPAGTARRAA
jgi:hypothetical protein